MAYFVIVAKSSGEDRTYYNYPEQVQGRTRLKDIDGLEFDTLDEADEFLDMRGIKREEAWAYPSTGVAAPGSTMIWFLRMTREGFRLGARFQLCKVNGSRKPKYQGTHPANISKGLLEIAGRVGGKDAEALKTYAGDVERLMKSAGVKHI